VNFDVGGRLITNSINKKSPLKRTNLFSGLLIPAGDSLHKQGMDEIAPRWMKSRHGGFFGKFLDAELIPELPDSPF